MGRSVTIDGYMLGAVLVVLEIASIYWSGRIAEQRGRSFKTWAWTSGLLIGPLAIPVLLLLPSYGDKSRHTA